MGKETCPGCGAAMGAGDAAKCPACGRWVVRGSGKAAARSGKTVRIAKPGAATLVEEAGRGRVLWECVIGARVVPVGPTAKTLGRDAERAQIHVDDPSVSGRHALLVPQGDGIDILDMNSSNGTKLHGVPYPRIQLTKAATVRFGSVDVNLRPAAGGGEPHRARLDHSSVAAAMGRAAPLPERLRALLEIVGRAWGLSQAWAQILCAAGDQVHVHAHWPERTPPALVDIARDLAARAVDERAPVRDAGGAAAVAIPLRGAGQHRGCLVLFAGPRTPPSLMQGAGAKELSELGDLVALEVLDSMFDETKRIDPWRT